MNVLVLNGSPKRRSNTMRLTKSFLQGLNGDGEHQVETIDIIKKQIKPCVGCFGCWNNPNGRCVQTDDQNEILDKFVAADIVIFSFPLYCYGMPSHLKAVVDRTIPLMKKSMKEEKGSVVHDMLVDISGKHYVVISGCGFPNWNGNFDALKLQCKNMYGDNLTTICVPETPLLFVPAAVPYVTPLLDKFRAAGARYGKTLTLSRETIAELETPMMPTGDYLELANSRG